MLETRRPFIVNAANVESGEEFQSRIWAADEREAAALVRRKGIAISTIFEEPLPVVALTAESIASPSPVVGELRQLRIDVEAVRRSRLLRAPIGTIAVSIIIAWILGMVLLFLALIPLAPLLRR